MERHPLAEPADGWVPAPGLPSAPQGWRFWDVDRRAVPAARRPRILVLVGNVLAGVGIAATIVLTVRGGALGWSAVLGLVPVVAGAAVAVTATVRRAGDEDAWVTRAVERSRTARTGPAEWGPDALPFVERAEPVARPLRRGHRAGVVVLAAAAVVVVVAGATVAISPLFALAGGTGQTLAVGLQDDGSTPTESASPTGGATDADPTTPPVPSTIAVDAQLEDGTARQADCEVAMAGSTEPAHCWAWALTAPAECHAKVTARFGPTGDTATRTEVRYVTLTPGVVLSLVLRGDETVAGLDHPECVGAGEVPYAIGTYDAGVPLPDADFPAACDDWGCDGFIFAAEASCDAATIQIAVDDVAADRHSRDYVVVQPVVDSSSTAHNEVFVPYEGGTQPADAEVTSVTCEG